MDLEKCFLLFQIQNLFNKVLHRSNPPDPVQSILQKTELKMQKYKGSKQKANLLFLFAFLFTWVLKALTYINGCTRLDFDFTKMFLFVKAKDSYLILPNI